MKKNIQHTVLSLLCLFVIGMKPVHANHVLGMDIQWRSLGNDTFEISMSVYRRCTDGASSLNLASSPLTMVSDSCSSTHIIAMNNIVSYVISDITPVSANTQKPCQISGGNGNSSASMPVGIEQHTIKYKVYLGGANANCCWYKMRWQSCCRSSTITTGCADVDFYSEAWLNRCISPQDNGPQFTNKPLMIKCAGQEVVYNNGVVDLDGDSISYATAQPLGGSYSTPWSNSYPLTCLGGNNPNPNANPSTGFNLDPITGTYSFRPMQVQMTVIKVMVTEWRKDTNGIYKVIGKTARDMQFIIVQNCNNKLPSLSGPFAYETCVGMPICITINTNDQDINDTTRIEWNSGIKNATWVTNNGTVKRATGYFCWTPDSNDVQSLPHYFSTSVSDNHGGLVGSSTRSYSITVFPTYAAKTKVVKIKSGKYSVQMKKSISVKTNPPLIRFYSPQVLG